MYKRFGKRFSDIIIAVAGLIVLSPLFIFLTLLLYFLNNRQPFFYQPRPGLNRKIFIIIKFKTMTDPTQPSRNENADHQRITTIGGLLRKTSLDELPQLWNVLKGEMSLIGPRPLLTEYLPLYNNHEIRRHEVKPGITGWGQVHGRNNISWTEKFKYDLWYVENQSLALDMNILFLTIKSVFSHLRTNAPQAIPDKFQGSQN